MLIFYRRSGRCEFIDPRRLPAVSDQTPKYGHVIDRGDASTARLAPEPEVKDDGTDIDTQ
jgi:hypothetical protein